MREKTDLTGWARMAHDRILQPTRGLRQNFEAPHQFLVLLPQILVHLLGQHGLSDNELAHHVDHTVDLVQIDADRLYTDRPRAVLVVVLVATAGRLRGTTATACALGGDRRRLLGHRLDFGQKVGKARSVEIETGIVFGFAFFRRRQRSLGNIDIAIAFDEFEDFADFVLGYRLGGDLDVPGAVNAEGFEFVEPRQVVDIGDHHDLAQFGKFAQQQKRVIGA